MDSHHLNTLPDYSRDETFVVDVFDRREDLSVQVKLSMNGEWHKKAVGGVTTACGESMGAYATRDDQYMGKLCTTCFTAYEISLIPSSPNAPDAPYVPLALPTARALTRNKPTTKR